VEAGFEHVKGVADVKSDILALTSYCSIREKSAQGTGHAESFASPTTRPKLLWSAAQGVLSVAHDPTELNRQGPDRGSQYRSAIFYSNEEQKRIAQAYIEQLNRAKCLRGPS